MLDAKAADSRHNSSQGQIVDAKSWQGYDAADQSFPCKRNQWLRVQGPTMRARNREDQGSDVLNIPFAIAPHRRRHANAGYTENQLGLYARLLRERYLLGYDTQQWFAADESSALCCMRCQTPDCMSRHGVFVANQPRNRKSESRASVRTQILFRCDQGKKHCIEVELTTCRARCTLWDVPRTAQSDVRMRVRQDGTCGRTLTFGPKRYRIILVARWLCRNELFLFHCLCYSSISGFAPTAALCISWFDCCNFRKLPAPNKISTRAQRGVHRRSGSCSCASCKA